MAKLNGKSDKNNTSRMLDANNISARSCVHCVSLECLQAGSKITLTPSRHQINYKTEMSYVII